jgi:hypothetical protein
MTDGTPEQPARRRMRLPYNPEYPSYSETHLEDGWCAQAGCTPVTEPPLDVQCPCGNRYSLHMHTVCPKCFRVPPAEGR